MIPGIEDPRIQKILNLPGRQSDDWKHDLERLVAGDVTLDRHTAGENSIMSLQRMLIFLGYSTMTTGAFAVDGDLGRGTNRGVAHFAFEHNLPGSPSRAQLCYDCTYRNARARITAIPDVRVTVPILEKMVEVALGAIEEGNLLGRDFDVAMEHLNRISPFKAYSAAGILETYGPSAEKAVSRLREEGRIDNDIDIRWILSIIRIETGGVVRPRLEQHWLSKFNKQEQEADLTDLRMRSMSFGLGQVMGFNFRTVGASSAESMFQSSLEDQVYFISRFLIGSNIRKEVVVKSNPVNADYHDLARSYNGRSYRNNLYHEKLERAFREFTKEMEG